MWTLSATIAQWYKRLQCTCTTYIKQILVTQAGKKVFTLSSLFFSKLCCDGYQAVVKWYSTVRRSTQYTIMGR